MPVPRSANAKSALSCFLADPRRFPVLCRWQAMAIDSVGAPANPFDQDDVFEPAHGVSAAIPIVDRRVNQRIAKLAIDFRVKPERRESSKLAVVRSEANDTYEISVHNGTLVIEKCASSGDLSGLGNDARSNPTVRPGHAQAGLGARFLGHRTRRVQQAIEDLHFESSATSMPWRVSMSRRQCGEEQLLARGIPRA